MFSQTNLFTTLTVLMLFRFQERQEIKYSYACQSNPNLICRDIENIRSTMPLFYGLIENYKLCNHILKGLFSRIFLYLQLSL